VVQAGKARYLGASSMHAWQFAQALYNRNLNGWTRFVSMQNYYNLLYREEERRCCPSCRTKVSVRSRGVLGARATHSSWNEQTHRRERRVRRSLYTDDDRPIVDTVIDIAHDRGVTPAQIALAWVLSNPAVNSRSSARPRPSTSRRRRRGDLRLDDGEIQRLEEQYRPHGTLGFR